jgi:hypothetical protein
MIHIHYLGDILLAQDVENPYPALQEQLWIESHFKFLVGICFLNRVQLHSSTNGRLDDNNVFFIIHLYGTKCETPQGDVGKIHEFSSIIAFLVTYKLHIASIQLKLKLPHKAPKSLKMFSNYTSTVHDEVRPIIKSGPLKFFLWGLDPVHKK